MGKLVKATILPVAVVSFLFFKPFLLMPFLSVLILSRKMSRREILSKWMSSFSV